MQLLGRAGTQHAFGPAGINEYYLQLSNTGAWSIVRNTTSGTLTTLASGTVTAPGTGTWQHLALTFNGDSISAAINGTTVGTVTDSSYPSGMVGFGTSGYQADQFDNLSVMPPPAASHEIEGHGGKCADDNGNSSAVRAKVQAWSCVNDASQRMVIHGR